jgi:2-phospho-L-lactate transferase/gluconeogenesis factor (CofD/UPF0052 family)
MWQPGETMHYTASQHLRTINEHAGRNLIDCVVMNDAPIPPAVRRKYARARVRPVENDFNELEDRGIKVVTADLLSVTAENKIRHNPEALAGVVINLASRSRAFQVRRRALTRQPKTQK